MGSDGNAKSSQDRWVTMSDASETRGDNVSSARRKKGRESGNGKVERNIRPKTPADSRPVPKPDKNEELFESPGYFLNRELTWLNFNFRVLHEARDVRTPLLERLKFLSICSSNLDEFFMKRIGGLKQQVGAGLTGPSIDGRSPREQIDESYGLIRLFEARKAKANAQLFSELKKHKIQLLSYEDLGKDEQARLRKYYFANVFPLVTPQATDPAHPFPFISNLALNLLVSLRYPGEDNPTLARIKVPLGSGISRFLKVGDLNRFIPLEEVMAHNLDLIFPEGEILSCEVFRVTRNANTEKDEERAEDLLSMIESELRERRFAPIVRVEINRDMSGAHRGFLAAELGLDPSDVFEVDGMLGMTDLMELARLEEPHLQDPPHHSIDNTDLTKGRSIFHSLRETEGVLLQHPYESFSTSVERFLREASNDPKVRAIKMTLYRTSAEGNVIQYLINAARNGKQVAVVMEIKARFDEEANINWASRLEEAGIHVTYGVVGLKTHTKITLVVRQDFDGLRRYSHIGTGNYHAGTARIYTDFGLLTRDEEIGQDLTELFNYLTTGYKPKRHFHKVLPAPKLLKRALLDKIEREIEVHTKKSPGLIRFKLNALEDSNITSALYRAAKAGVRIELVVRDTCRLRPGIPDLTENVQVVSVLGRFLEHGRIFYFRNGGEEELYIGSADCMKRNLESRVEVLVPVESKKLREELNAVFEAQLSDTRSAWEMSADGSYSQRIPKDEDAVSSQVLLMRRAEKRQREADRLRSRKPQGIARRKGRQGPEANLY